MRVLFLLTILGLLFFSCKKNYPAVASQSVTGTLRYIDPAVDGPGLYYETDSLEPLLFKNEFSDYNTQYLHYIDFLYIHTRLTFIDRGETGCPLGMVPCPQQYPARLVEVVKLENE